MDFNTGLKQRMSDNNRRHHIRKSLISTVSVFNCDTDEYVGLVADYSRDGMMVASIRNPIPVGQTYHYLLLVQSPHAVEDAGSAYFEAESVWCEQSSPSFYGMGFHLAAFSPVARKVPDECVIVQNSP